MDISALFKLSYGIYLITSHDGETNAGCLVNTVFQITAEPVRIGVSVSKQNQTHEAIEASGSIAVNIVGETAASPLLGKFGYRTGREIDKFAELKCHKDSNGDMYIDEHGIIAQFSCKVLKAVDMDTHTIFICDVTDAQHVQEGEAMTYDYYREVKRLKSSKFAPTYVAEAHA